ncbi:acyltransferase family protein [Haloechinothrix halophila]|uniref:acyltransferase family protein n=1 Tax=Haloechinothrix halophila TaxID=1069073 RepID=UPI000426724E|nr:acyltransferase [Haloechinothrix halophila]
MVAVDTGASGGASPGPVTTRRRFFPELEGMRGFAALGVLVTHVAFSSSQVGWDEVPGFEQQGNGFAANLLQQLHVSLPIFFVLSGMLLYRPFVLSTIADTRSPRLRPYFWRRALRTLPGYWVCLGVVLITLNTDLIENFWDVLRPVLLLQVYEQGAHVAGLEQAWSLATEVAFYATLPVFAALLHRFARKVSDPGQRARRILTGLSLGLIVGIAFTIYTHQPSMGVYPMQNEWPIGWVGFIAIGMALATLSATAEVAPHAVPAPYRLVMDRPILPWIGAVVVYLLACVSPFGDPGKANYPAMDQALVEHIAYLSFGLLIVAPLTVPDLRSRFIKAVLSNPVTLYLGRISYGLYLWHIAIIYYYSTDGVLFQVAGFGELLVVTLLGSTIAATLSYYVVEKPAMALRERLGKTTRTPSVAVLDNTQERAPVPSA